MMRMRGIWKTYPAASREVVALRNANLEMRQGEFAVMVGRSGAGKSTLLGTLGGLIRPTAGSVFFEGVSLWDLDERSRAQLRAREVGFVLQSAPALRTLTVRENVELAAWFADAPGRRTAGSGCPAFFAAERAAQLMERLGLSSKADRFPWQLSGGEKRRLAIAGALVNRPSLILADEPTADLDPDAEAAVLGVFREAAADGAAVLLVTHNRELVRFADRVLVLEAGEVAEPAPAALQNKSVLVAAAVRCQES